MSELISNLANSPDVEWAAMRCLGLIAACFVVVRAGMWLAWRVK